MKRVLIVCAHPDDEVLSCGGVISKYTKLGVEFKVLFIAEGSTCRFNDPTSQLASIAIAERESMSRSALKILGVKDFEFHNLPCGQLDQVPILVINKIIEKAIDTFRPDTVLTHSSIDVNNDHRIIFNSTIMAVRPVPNSSIERVMSYEILSSSEWAVQDVFRPNYFISISQQDLEDKWAALKLYASEILEYPHPRSELGIKALAMYRGMQAGFQYAESFVLLRGRYL